jgi:hypothetical protein
MNDTAYDTCDGFKFGRVYIMVPCQLHTLECNNDRAKAKI